MEQARLDKYLAEQLPEFGHRNWIVIADSAYPAQSNEAIQTVYVGGAQLDAVRRLLEAIERAPHVRPTVLVDAELQYVPESDAPGVTRYREGLRQVLGDTRVERLPHEEIIAELDEVASLFRVLVIKTEMTIPYTSVFVRLDCAYWSDEAESRLREAMPRERSSD
jgi:hypothetical protein